MGSCNCFEGKVKSDGHNDHKHDGTSDIKTERSHQGLSRFSVQLSGPGNTEAVVRI